MRYYIGGRAGERCDRATLAGSACAGARVPVLHYVFPSCRSHMTELEVLTRDAMLAMDQAGEVARLGAVEPACWSWPLPDYLVQPDDLDAVADWQDDRCAVCGSRRRPQVEDHDHDTGWVRGYLCRSCNALEGTDGRPGVFTRYRQRNPATMLGVRVRYVSPLTGPAMPRPQREDNLDASPAHDVARLLAGG